MVWVLMAGARGGKEFQISSASPRHGRVSTTRATGSWITLGMKYLNLLTNAGVRILVKCSPCLAMSERLGLAVKG